MWGTRACIVVLLAVLASGEAEAKGPGFKLGGALLHPRLRAAGNFIVNPGYLSNDELAAGADEARNDTYITVGPGFDLELETERMVLTVGGDLNYRRYIKNERLSAVVGDVKGSFNYNRNGPYAFKMSQALTRYADGGVDSVTTRLLHVVNVTTLGVDMRPGGGALMIGINYGFFYDYYDREGNSVSPATARSLDSLRHQPELAITWKFLPKTALFLQGQGDIARYPSGAAGTNLNANIVRSYLGLVGDVTPRVRAVLKGGYGNSLAGDAGHSVLAQAELGYAFSPTANARLGYTRSIMPTSLYGFLTNQRAYLGYQHMFLGKTNLDLSFAYVTQAFGPPAAANATLSAGRSDQSINGSAGIEHFFRDWIALGLFNRLDMRFSNEASFSYLVNDTSVRLTVTY